MKNCSFCGAENEDAAVFCEECVNASMRNWQRSKEAETIMEK
jgi:uncharacterized membrane protein YvbJ